MEQLYKLRCETPGDINEHLPTLRKYAEQCNSVVECGVLNIVSSYAFACGLKNNVNNYFVMIDPFKSNDMDFFLNVCKQENVNAYFINDSDLKSPLIQTDLLFIDTWHVYGHLKRELSRWHSCVNKYIIMHDTTIDEWYGETIRCGMNAEIQSKDVGIPVNEINKGIWYAIEEFLTSNKNWSIKERFTNNNGLTILERND